MQGVVGFVTTSLLQIYRGIFQWKKIVNRLRFDGHEFVASLFGPPYTCIPDTDWQSLQPMRTGYKSRRCIMIGAMESRCTRLPIYSSVRFHLGDMSVAFIICKLPLLPWVETVLFIFLFFQLARFFIKLWGSFGVYTLQPAARMSTLCSPLYNRLQYNGLYNAL